MIRSVTYLVFAIMFLTVSKEIWAQPINNYIKDVTTAIPTFLWSRFCRNRMVWWEGTSGSEQRKTGFNPGSGTGSYSYDVNGNMTNDPYKIMAITYNHLNLPTQFNFGSGKAIDMLYDRTGVKLRKTILNTGAVFVYAQDYVGGLEYRTNTSGGTPALEAIYHPEGRITPNGASWRYEYYIKDHLGNTRLTFADLNGNGIVDVTGNNTTTEILNENHYYPFGMNMAYDWINNSAAGMSIDNKYQYNGKEFNDDFGLNLLDYGARWYDAGVGRFWNPDPIIEQFPYLTPFNYASHNPITNIDLWGLQGAPSNDMWGALGIGGEEHSHLIGKAQSILNGAKSIINTVGSTITNTTKAVGQFINDLLPDEGSSADDAGKNSEDYSHDGSGIEVLSGTNVPGNGTAHTPTAEGGATVAIGTDEIVIPNGGGSGGLGALGSVGEGLQVAVDGLGKAKDAETVSGFVMTKELNKKVETAPLGKSYFIDKNNNIYELNKQPVGENGAQSTTITKIKNNDN